MQFRRCELGVCGERGPILSEGGVWIAGCKLVWVSIWFWAATSKLNRHFPSVIAAMLTNSPFVPGPVKRRLYRDFPDPFRHRGEERF